MTRTPKRPQVYGVCAVCGCQHGQIFGFKHTLRLLGVRGGTRAVPGCVEKLAREGAAERKAKAMSGILRDRASLPPALQRLEDEGTPSLADKVLERPTRVRREIVRVLEGRGPKPKERT
jgi:hypothetical protein